MQFRFSIRFALIALTVGALLSLVLAQAVRGELWAVGAAFGAASLLLVFAPFVLWTWLLMATSALLSAKPDNRRRQSPTETPPAEGGGS